MKKRIFAALLAGCMAASLVACGSTGTTTTDNTDSTPAASGTESSSTDDGAAATVDVSDFEFKDYTIALPLPEAGITSFEIFRSICDQIESVIGGKFVNAAGDLTAEGNISFVEQQIAAGVDGLIVCPAADSVLPTITTMCEEAGVYWTITMRSISDPDIKAMVEASPYYVGNCYEDEETAGYECGKWMGEQGYKKIAIISQTKGDTTCDTREVGLAKACDEYGMEIVGEGRGAAQASDITASVESFLAANSDLDCVYVVGSGVTGSHEAVLKAIQDAGRGDDVKMVTVDFPNEMQADFESGILVYSYAQVCLAFDPYITLFKLINAIEGTPILTADGSAVTSNHMYMLSIDNAEDAAEYTEVLGNPEYKFFSDEEIANLCVWNNPDLNEDTLQEIIDNYSVQNQ